MTNNLHLTYIGPSHWRLGEERSSHVRAAFYATKDIALAGAVGIAKHLKRELVIHKRNGEIQDRRSFGNDPSHRPG
jgi:hypothetical protein